MTDNANDAGPRRWCILRTAGPRTLALAKSLEETGFTVWTPTDIRRRVINRGRKNQRKLDVEAPVFPSVVFAAEGSELDLIRLSRRPFKREPAFNVFRVANRVPLIGDHEIAGLREYEARLLAVHRAMKEAESRDAAEAIRIAAMEEEANRRREMKEAERRARAAMRRDAPQHHAGSQVRVSGDPAFVGVVGIVEAQDGADAWVRFGKHKPWKIEAWRLIPIGVATAKPLRTQVA